MNRRSFLRGAVALAPAVILTPGLLMPVRKPWIGFDLAAAHAEDVEWAMMYNPPMTATEVLRLRKEFFARVAQANDILAGMTWVEL